MPHERFISDVTMHKCKRTTLSSDVTGCISTCEHNVLEYDVYHNNYNNYVAPCSKNPIGTSPT